MANKPSKAQLEAKAAKLSDNAQAKIGDYADTKQGATEEVGGAAETAVNAQEAARFAQGQVDRLEEHTTEVVVGAEDMPGNKPHGVVNDAWGPPAAEIEAAAEAERKSK